MLKTNRSPRYVQPKLSKENVRWIKELLPGLSSEIGGSIELNSQGSFERFTVYTSTRRTAMTLPDFFQIEYHCHFDPYAIQLPSITDLKIAMKRKLGYDKKATGVSGQLNVVFCLKGVVVYRYDGKEKHADRIFGAISDIMNSGRDDARGMRDQIEKIEEISNFKFSFTTWDVAARRGVKLGKFCLKEIVVNPA